jgi:hypothetical protein
MSSPHVQHASFVCLLYAVTQPIDRTLYLSSPTDDRPPATRHAANQMPQPPGGPGPTLEAPETATCMVEALSRGTSTLWRSMAPLACGEGSSRRHASASACDCEQHHRPQPRTAAELPRRTPVLLIGQRRGKSLVHRVLILSPTSPAAVHGTGSREPVSASGKPPALCRPMATLAPWRQTCQPRDGLAHPTAPTRTGAPPPGWPVAVVGDRRCAPRCRDRGWPLQRPRSVPG